MPDVINDAAAYGVRIIPADVQPGQPYWKVIRVHHLSPQENNRRHHIFLDAVDEAHQRLYGTLFAITWDGGRETVMVEKSPPEFGANFPMWKWQVCSVEALGAPSDRVINLRTDHPQEGEGNPLFHHSFAITYLYTIASQDTSPSYSVLQGRVPGGGGHTLVLMGQEQVMGTQIVGRDERYHFAGLPAGVYLIKDEQDWRVAGPVVLNGRDEVTLDLPPLAQQDRVFAHYVLFSQPHSPKTQVYLSLLADRLAQKRLPFGFDLIDARQAQRVSLVGEHPQETWHTLEEAGCQVQALPLDPTELLKALDEMA